MTPGDDDDVRAFLAAYADTCAEAGVAPLGIDDLIALLESLPEGQRPGILPAPARGEASPGRRSV